MNYDGGVRGKIRIYTACAKTDDSAFDIGHSRAVRTVAYCTTSHMLSLNFYFPNAAWSFQRKSYCKRDWFEMVLMPIP